MDLGITLPDHSGSSFAAHAASVSSGALLQVLIFTSIIEICTIKAVEGLKDGSRKPGDYSFDPLGFSKTPAARAKYEVNELKNGSWLFPRFFLTLQPLPLPSNPSHHSFLSHSPSSFLLFLSDRPPGHACLLRNRHPGRPRPPRLPLPLNLNPSLII